ncbi:MAG: stage II sporulation protein M, partial [Candidatus Thorarchaeota archaeon]
KFSLMSLAITEVLSTALTVGGIAVIRLTAPPPFGGNIALFLASILPHAILEIPIFLVAAAAAIRIAKDLWPTIEAEDWASIPSRTRTLLGDGRTWRTFALIMFLLVIAALIEAFVTHHIMDLVLAG